MKTTTSYKDNGRWQIRIDYPPEDYSCGRHPFQRFSWYPHHVIGGSETEVWIFLWWHIVLKMPTYPMWLLHNAMMKLNLI